MFWYLLGGCARYMSCWLRMIYHVTTRWPMLRLNTKTLKLTSPPIQCCQLYYLYYLLLGFIVLLTLLQDKEAEGTRFGQIMGIINIYTSYIIVTNRGWAWEWCWMKWNKGKLSLLRTRYYTSRLQHQMYRLFDLVC